jgi:transcriptional regulator with XRE-family HTH domain
VSNLKKIRIIDKNISQFELSRRSGVHPSRISLLENDLKMPSMSEAKRISEALGMLPEEIFGLDAVMRRLTASRKRETE